MNRPKIILIIASSLDGRIAYPDGRESNFGSKEDRKILNEAISEVDATIFGSKTLKTHKSTYLVKDYLSDQNQEISTNQPISIIAGDSQNIPLGLKYFDQPVQRWIINSKKHKNQIVRNFDKQFHFINTWRETLGDLANEGIKSIGLLGGAKLITSFAKEDLIDEIKITIVPKIVGGKFSWIMNHDKNIIEFIKDWEVKSFKKLKTNEVFIHYINKKDN